MKDWGRLEICSMAVISTGHIPEKDAKILERKYKDSGDVYEAEDHWINDLNIGTSEYGYFISVTSMKRRVKEAKNVEDWIKETLEFCLDVGVTWIHYDQDADTVDNLRVYDW